MRNARFSEYTTSGAFALSLTRNQVAALSIVDGGVPDWASNVLAHLERKGLAERVPSPTEDNPERIEFRLTRAGLLTVQLCDEAGLTNGEPDPLGRELADLRAEIVVARQQAADATRLAHSAMARRDELENVLENERRRAAGEKMLLRFGYRDPTPDKSDHDLAGEISALGPA